MPKEPRLPLARLQPHPELKLCHRYRRHLGKATSDRSNPARCTQCLAFKQGKQECQPERHWVNHHNFQGHDVINFLTDSGFHLWACRRCCAWAQFAPRFLGLHCLATPTPANRRDFELLMKGQHPQYPDDKVYQVSDESLAAYRIDNATCEVKEAKGFNA